MGEKPSLLRVRFQNNNKLIYQGPISQSLQMCKVTKIVNKTCKFTNKVTRNYKFVKLRVKLMLKNVNLQICKFTHL